MPDWSSEEELNVDMGPEGPEDWATIFQVVVEMQKKKTSADVMDMLTPPEREDLEKAVALATASLLTERILDNPAAISKLPNPQLLVHAMILGALGGLIYAAANLPDEDDPPQPPE